MKCFVFHYNQVFAEFAVPVMEVYVKVTNLCSFQMELCRAGVAYFREVIHAGEDIESPTQPAAFPPRITRSPNQLPLLPVLLSAALAVAFVQDAFKKVIVI